MEHHTPLTYHFQHWHIWFDMAVLALLFVAAAYVPLLKIVPLVASLELFSFFSFHLLAKSSRFQLQGFLGGFISSTAVFLQTLNDRKFASTSERELLLTLLFALCAMLIECLFIVFFLSDNLPLVYYLPFITQLIVFATTILYVSTSNRSRFASNPVGDSNLDIDLLNDHPIIWKNVAKFSLLILVIISVMRFAGSELGLPPGISTLIVSLFEAHAILASVMTEWSLQRDDVQLLQLFFLILLGNTVSKSYLAYKGSNLVEKGFFLAVMAGGLLTSLGVTLLWWQLTG